MVFYPGVRPPRPGFRRVLNNERRERGRFVDVVAVSCRSSANQFRQPTTPPVRRHRFVWSWSVAHRAPLSGDERMTDST